MKVRQITQQVVLEGRNHNLDWFHPKAAVIPPKVEGQPPTVLVTVHLVSGNDAFSPLFEIVTHDLGATWTEPVMHLNSLGRHRLEEHLYEGIIDFAPKYHPQTDTVLGIGHTARYINKADDVSLKREFLDHSNYPRYTAYAVKDLKSDTWAPWQTLVPPDEPRMAYFSVGGCSQHLYQPDGTLLVAARWKGSPEEKTRAGTILCEFDGTRMRAIKAGNELVETAGRGFAEPSIVHWQDRYLMTLRAENFRMWHSCSRDGLNWDPQQPWCWDDGEEIETDQTQQHWLKRHEELYLVYTRKSELNHGVMRCRAPLFMAQVDTDRLCLIRETEQIVVPENRARLGNFMVENVTPWESWVTVGEWVQTEYIGDLLLGRIEWTEPNLEPVATGGAVPPAVRS